MNPHMLPLILAPENPSRISKCQLELRYGCLWEAKEPVGDKWESSAHPAVPQDPWGHRTLFSTRTFVLPGMGGVRSPPPPVNSCAGRSALLRSCQCPPQGSITLISCQGVGEAISLGHFSSSVAYSQWSRFRSETNLVVWKFYKVGSWNRAFSF